MPKLNRIFILLISALFLSSCSSLESLSEEIQLNQYYSKDNISVYFEGREILNADSDSFEIIEKMDYYSKDKNRVYHLGREIKGADPETFSVISVMISKDKNHVYYGHDTTDLDPETAELIHIDHSIGNFEGFIKDKKGVYLDAEGLTLVEDADPATFEKMSKDTYYWKDKNHVFKLNFGGKGWFADIEKLEGVDPDSFEMPSRHQ